MTNTRTLLIASHVIHYAHEGRVWAYGPYTREIDIWADLFPEVVIASPLRRETPPKDCLPFLRDNIRMRAQLETGGDSLWEKCLQVLALPAHIAKLGAAMFSADAIHVRCPGNISLLAAAMAPLFSNRLIAKYAGQWNGYAGEPLSVRLQRRILLSRWWRKGLVTVYGEWPDQPPQVIPFFTSMMTEAQVRRSAEVAAAKQLTAPLRILVSGRLEAVKRVEVVLRGASVLMERGVPFELTIVGDGSRRQYLMDLAEGLGLAQVRFVGAVSFDEMMRWYEWGHALVLAAEHSEGWPKVLAEAMCHGLVCVATDHGLIPWMLKDRGLTFPAGSETALAGRLSEIARDPVHYRAMSEAGGSWARNYSLEKLHDALRALLSSRWGALAETSSTDASPRTATAR